MSTKNQENKICQNCKNDFVIESDDFGFYEKINVPPPTFCSACRFQRRLSYRNERVLFKVKDAFNGSDIFSLYPPEAGYKVVTQDEWYGDSWDALDFGRDYDFLRPCFLQLFELDKNVPAYGLNVSMMINSPYSGNAHALKNCYLCFNSNNSENCMYGNAVDHSKDCIDNSYVNKSERCYNSLWLENCYQCYDTTRSFDCRNLYFCRGCVDCNDCLGSTNLRNKSYCIFNEQYTKEEYERRLKEMKLDTNSGYENFKIQSKNFHDTQINRFNPGIRNINSTGTYLSDTKNVKNSYFINESEDLRFCQYLTVPGNKDTYDASIWGNRVISCYETSVCGNGAYNLKFCFDCWPECRNCEYSLHLKNCSDCFACVGLKNKQYCILNKQYTKEEYFVMLEKIKKQMDDVPYVDQKGSVYKYGEFFPIELSPFGYNNTIATFHFPMNEKEALSQGYKWIDVKKGNYEITKKASELPESIKDVADNIVNEVVECESCSMPFRIIENELTFYRNENLPLPRKCINCRYLLRISERLNFYLYDIVCMCVGSEDKTGKYKNTIKHEHGGLPCQNSFKTGYNPEDKNIVYCEKCYQQEVY